MSEPVIEILRLHKQGIPAGVTSLCTAHPVVLEAAARLSARSATTSPLLIESTCNQVNQDGGYMGMTPGQFVEYVREICERSYLDLERLVLAGDHLGPFPWRHLSAEKALGKAIQLVKDYVLAGYSKIHLDASMPCADDPALLPVELIAQRTAQLCAAAEQAASTLPDGLRRQVYVIGSEVPTPGGIQAEHDSLQVTGVDAVESTIETTRKAFYARNLEPAWERVIALVVQPGIEFGERVVYPYVREKARPLSRFIESNARLVFEAHSTDYQTPGSLRQLVEDHFAILKVGPALTFAFREAVFALSGMEVELLSGRPGVRISRLPEVLEEVMQSNPAAWKAYYQGDEADLRLARRFSYSDRSRYYWSDQRLQDALALLFMNLQNQPLPENLISQYMPAQYARLRSGLLGARPVELVMDHIWAALIPYKQACGEG